MKSKTRTEFDAVCHDVFARGRETRTFPGGVVHCQNLGQDWALRAAYGFLTYDESEPVHKDTLYDIASLTKLFTATAFLSVAEAHGIALDTPLARFYAEFAAPPLGEITLRHLLQHSSGLALHVQELANEPPETWPARVAAAGLVHIPGAAVRYTCTAYVLLGWIIEAVTGASLESVMMARVVEPLGLRRTCYNAAQKYPAAEIAPTEINAVTSEPWRGIVHDEASRALGGVAGNSGLFSTAADLGIFAAMWLRGGAHAGHQIISEAAVARALTDAVQADNYRQAYGWHLDVSSWMSLRAPRGTAGHLGFTGPMLWVCPERGLSLVVLNNRVHPTREGPKRMGLLREISEAALG